jgi:hypothetical protein
MRSGELARLLDPAPLEQENESRFLDDGVGFVAVRVAMPKVTGEMVDWWFDWHPDDPVRYRMWHPGHRDISIERPERPGGKPFWNTVHHPVEDVGLGDTRVRIEFVPPEQFGFPAGAEQRPEVATIVCGFAGDDAKRARHTRMTHVWLNAPGGGTFMRSRFWLGAALRPYLPAPLATPSAWLINRPLGRRLLIPRAAPDALARHCREEYSNLAEFLPGLYAKQA